MFTLTPALQSPHLCRVRTLTSFITLTPDSHQWPDIITTAGQQLDTLRQQLTTLGYTVQTLRLVTNPFGQYLDTSTEASTLRALAHIQSILESPTMPQTVRIRFALGAATPDTLHLVPALIQHFGDYANVCLNVPDTGHAVPDSALTQRAAQIIQTLSQSTPRGEGNFNFTVNYNCPEFIPYFPASYHLGSESHSLVLGLESTDLLYQTLQCLPPTQSTSAHYQLAARALTTSLQHHVDQLIPTVQSFCHAHGLTFRGLDSSAAPSPDCHSIVDLYQSLGVPHFGAAGSLTVSALLTRVFKSLQRVPLVGFSGLMLAALEDRGLARDAAAGHYDIRTFLANSAVCGIGIDTVPIPADTPLDRLTAIMLDTGTLAFRLRKPLTVRLFPAAGLSAGQLTQFQSPDLCNCGVLAVE